MQTADWFEGALRADVVAAHLRTHVPAFADGSSTLVRCRVTRIRSVPPQGSWTATYELDIGGDQTAPERTVVVRGILTPPDRPLPPAGAPGVPLGAEDWGCVLPELRLVLDVPPFDATLPGLAPLLDSQDGARLLDQALHSSGVLAAGVSVTGCVARIASHKPGVRATVVCTLGYTGSPSGPGTVVVKVHSDDEGRRGHEALESLAASPLVESRVVRFPRPLGHVPELRLSVQQHCAHDVSLKDLFHSAFDHGRDRLLPGLSHGVEAAAGGLAALHRCGSRHGAPASWEEELAAVKWKHASLVAVVPELGDRVGTALERIEAMERATPADPLGPAHGSFHPAQVLVTEEGVAFIDFDKSGQAEPASDLGAFTTKLRHMAVNKVDTHGYDPDGASESAVEDLREVFIGGYRRGALVSEERLALWEALELFSLVLSASKKMLGPRTANCIAMLEHHLRTHGI
jgi:hypothetical protein